MEGYDSESEIEKKSSEDCFETKYELDDFTNELNCLKYGKSDLSEITSFFLYIDSNKTLSDLKTINIKLSIPNTILKRELLNLAKKYAKLNNKVYKLHHLLKYNFNIDERDVKNMENYCFLETVEVINDLSFHPTIEVISDINSIFFIYFESGNSKKTKKQVSASNSKTNKKYI
tara:strand:- start:52 stop:573 length:522 start_codon:yes stop_codon:yes gene_type:complete